MNWVFFALSLGIGSTAKLLTLKHPSPGEQWTAALVIVAESCAAGLIVPAVWDYRWLVLGAIPHAGGVLIYLGSNSISMFRVWREGRK